jgi:hypothetical protein
MLVTVCRLYETFDDASQTVSALESAGVPASDVSVISNNAERRLSAAPGAGATRIPISGGGTDTGLAGAYATPASSTESTGSTGSTGGTADTGASARAGSSGDTGTSPGPAAADQGDASADAAPSGGDQRRDAAGVGAAIGASAGTAGALIASLALFAVPGVGPVVGTGWLMALLGGAALGGVTGGLLGALTGAGLSAADAQVYAEGVRRGGTLVTARVPESNARRVEGIMDRHAVNAAERAAEYRQGGWRAFDPQAAPYTAEQVRSEHAQHAGR